MDSRIYLSPPHMGGNEQVYVKEAFDSNWVAPVGPSIQMFENQISSLLGGGHVAALSSGTAALHLALILLDIGFGDEVICSSFTFSGSVNPILYQKATPVFIDSEPETWNMDPELLEEGIKDRIKKGKKVKAIIVVHLYGMPARISEILEIAQKYDIPLIEDAAESLGSKYNNGFTGSFGELGIFSFNGNKIITTSGGGALYSHDRIKIERCKYLATQARQPAPHYEHTEIGYNYRLSNISAAIGRGQMEVLEDRVRRKREIFEYYKASFNKPYFGFQVEPQGFYSNRWLTAISTDNQAIKPESIRLFLEKFNIETRPLWKPMHMQPVFRDFPSFVSGVSQKLFESGLCLPSGTNLSDLDLRFIVDKMVEAYETLGYKG